MYAVTAMSGKSVKGITEFYCNDVNDIKNLPTKGIAPGSTAIVIASGRVFVLDCSMEWVELGGSNEMDILNLDDLNI